MNFDILYLVVAFGGGIFGAAIGGLPTFILCGFAAMIGTGIAAATGNADFTNLIAFGPILGPHISFAGGAAAAVYASRNGRLANGRDIATALLGIKAPDVLLVGGIFGALGYVLWWLIGLLPMIGDVGFTNPVALSIIINALIARVVFGKTGPFGKVRTGDNRWKASDVGNWLPWQTDPLELLLVGFGFGIMVAYTTTQIPGAAAVWFGVAAASLILLQAGFKVPVWHHIALSAEQAIAIGGGDIWWGLAFGIFSAFLGDFYGQLFTAHGDSHIDPPSASLFTTFTLMAILKATGAFAIAGVGSFVIMLVVAGASFGLAYVMKSAPNKGAVASKPA